MTQILKTCACGHRITDHMAPLGEDELLGGCSHRNADGRIDCPCDGYEEDETLWLMEHPELAP